MKRHKSVPHILSDILPDEGDAGASAELPEKERKKSVYSFPAKNLIRKRRELSAAPDGRPDTTEKGRAAES